MADEKVIDLDRLSRFHDNLKSTGLPLNNWQANKKYKVGYTVIQDGKLYRCKTEHTSTTNFDNTKFDLVGGSGSGIQNWAYNTSYSVGDLVVYGNGIYQCKTAHTSTNTFDDTKWTNLSIGYEKENLYTGTTFNTTTTTVTTSNSMLTKDFLIVKVAYSEDGTTVLMNKTFALVPVIGELQDFSYQESTTDYIVVTGEITDTTTFAFNFLEAYTIDNFKVVSIDGITLGSSNSGGSGGTTISDWATGITYSVSDLVIHDNNIYQCNTNHTSTTFTSDASNWNLIGGQGASEELYSSNTWLNADTNLTLSSAVTPYDFIIIKVDYSLDGTNTELSKTVIATNALSTSISLTLSRNSTQYCVAEGQLTSSTIFAVDALELTGFTKFRINKIIGVIGGGGSSSGDTPATSAQIQSLF